MAYRKVNDTSLASVAEAIRSKGDTSDALVFPDGFVSAISAIQTGGGGGTGGDLSAIGFSKMASGTITIASSTSSLIISHQLGAMPKIIFVYTKDYGVVLSCGYKAIESVFGVVFADTDGDSRAIRQITGKGNKSWTTLASLYSDISQGGFTSAAGSNKVGGFSSVSEDYIDCAYKDGGGYNYYFVTGATYEWLVLA